MGLSMRVDPVYLDGDLVDESDETGVETEALVALLSDARVDDGLLARGHPNRGYWVDSVLVDGEQLGSPLWLLEDALPSEETARQAGAYVEARLGYLVQEGRARAVAAPVAVTGTHVSVSPQLTLPDGSVRELGALRVN